MLLLIFFVSIVLRAIQKYLSDIKLTEQNIKHTLFRLGRSCTRWVRVWYLKFRFKFISHPMSHSGKFISTDRV